MPRPNSLRVNACLENARDKEHVHTCRAMKIHLQLFLACLLGLQAVGVAAMTWQRKLHVSPHHAGENLSYNFPPS